MADPARPITQGDEDTTDEWVRRVGALTVVPAAGCEVDEVAEATAAAERLALRARELIVLGIIPKDACPEGCTRCAAGVCDLVRELDAAFPTAFSDEDADVAPRPVEPDETAAEPAMAESALRRYRETLADVGGAVFTCRRTLHASGHCLFGDAEDDLCGRVLAAAHRLG
jgi:hypothetical protein